MLFQIHTLITKHLINIKIKKKGKAWIKEAIAVSKLHENLNFDVPNLHLLMEFIFRGLPIVMNTHFCRTGPYEGHHKQNKRGTH